MVLLNNKDVSNFSNSPIPLHSLVRRRRYISFVIDNFMLHYHFKQPGAKACDKSKILSKTSSKFSVAYSRSQVNLIASRVTILWGLYHCAPVFIRLSQRTLGKVTWQGKFKNCKHFGTTGFCYVSTSTQSKLFVLFNLSVVVPFCNVKNNPQEIQHFELRAQK